MRGRLILGAFFLLYLGLLMESADAQTAYVYLCADSVPAVNEPYQKDERTYDRDAIEPSIAGLEKVLYKQTKDVNWYLFSLSAPKDEPATLYLTLPNAESITTAY